MRARTFLRVLSLTICMGEGTGEIDAMALTHALGNEACLKAVDIATMVELNPKPYFWPMG
jgi:hypothetical protein